MRRHLVGAAVLVAALALPGLAAAKGPASASVSGPGLTRSLAVSGQGEGTISTPLGALVSFGGFMSQVYGESPDPTFATRPKGTLGPRYVVTYLLPGPNNVTSKLVQLAYPYAKPVPLTYMRPGQLYWGARKAHGGWIRAAADLKATLISAGLPAKAPQAGSR